MATPAVTISALQDSRWRCGVEHTPTPVDWPPGRWSNDELARLCDDPQLVVIVHDEPEDAGSEPPVLTQAQIARLRELTPGQIDAALAPPSTPTVQAALDRALSALRRATPGEVRAFFRAMTADPEIAAGVESGTGRREKLIAALTGMEIVPGENATRAGIPTVAALEALVGFDIVADERDAAWEEFRKAKAAAE